MSRSRLLRVVAATTVALLATAAPALAHTSVTPGQVDPDAEVTLAFRAPPERQAVNQSLRVLIPEQFVPGECAAPTTWSCDVDAETHAPHTVVTWTAPDPNVLTSVTFEVTVTAPSADDSGVYLFRALQDYSDGFTAPWAFEGDDYPAPTVQVGDDETVRNGAGSPNEPCFGPASPPVDGESQPEQEPCPTTASTADDTGTDDTTTDTSDDTTSPGTDATSSAAPAPAAAVESQQLANTGGGAALLALGLFGAMTTLRRRS